MEKHPFKNSNYSKNQTKHKKRLRVIVKKDESDEAYEDAWGAVFKEEWERLKKVS
jgi:hypothetical protein